MSLEQEIYDAVKLVLERENFVAKHTPRYEDDERVNILWLWAMENYDRLYDPEKGNIEQWLSGCRRRIIDIYRQDFQIKRVNGVFVTKDLQFPLTPEGESTEDIFFAAPEEKDMSYKEEIKPLYDIIDNEITDDTAWILYQGCVNPREDTKLANALGCSKVSLHSRRTLAKNKIRKIYKEYD